MGGTPASGSVVFAGILVNPKVYASPGTAGATLAPTLTLPDNAIGTSRPWGEFVAYMNTAAHIGDEVIYAVATGALSAVAPGTAARHRELQDPELHRRSLPTSAAGLVAIRLTN